jgi:glycogen debranching enzyme
VTAATSQPQSVSTADVTVIEGSNFCRSGPSGDIDPRQAEGFFTRDTRVISRWQLLIDDQPITALAVDGGESFCATFIGHGAPRLEKVEPTVVVHRRRLVGAGLREDITIHNHAEETLAVSVTLQVDADFADLFDVKSGNPRRMSGTTRRLGVGTLTFAHARAGAQRGVEISATGGTVSRSGFTWRVAVPPHESWRTTVHALPIDERGIASADFPDDKPLGATRPVRQRQAWHERVPVFRCENWALQQAVDRALADIAALRLPDPADPQWHIIAAGAPWFMTLFGRDSIITSMMLLPWDRSLVRGTLHALARRQGHSVDLFSEEEPGKILHEVRDGLDVSTALGGSAIYYGSIDATPLFVILLGAAADWGLPIDDIRALLPAADEALAWVDGYGDIDGDGFVEYRRKTDRGLANQGWKDSYDAISDRQGRLAVGPVALAEVQGYVFAAWQARARLARLLDDDATATRCAERAEQIRQRFEEHFWLDDVGFYALALDGHKRPLDALASNQGHGLWTGIVSADRAASVVRHLLSDDMFTGWGVRTLATTAGRYNPISYHNGSVWPHDNALLVAGLMRYGYADEARRVADGIIAASTSTSGRLPELFCGFPRSTAARPVNYPTACSPQAWAAATPLALVSAILQLRPDREARTVVADGVPPSDWGAVQIDGIDIAGASASIAVAPSAPSGSAPSGSAPSQAPSGSAVG